MAAHINMANTALAQKVIAWANHTRRHRAMAEDAYKIIAAYNDAGFPESLTPEEATTIEGLARQYKMCYVDLNPDKIIQLNRLRMFPILGSSPIYNHITSLKADARNLRNETLDVYDEVQGIFALAGVSELATQLGNTDDEANLIRLTVINFTLAFVDGDATKVDRLENPQSAIAA